MSQQLGNDGQNFETVVLDRTRYEQEMEQQLVAHPEFCDSANDEDEIAVIASRYAYSLLYVQHYADVARRAIGALKKENRQLACENSRGEDSFGSWLERLLKCAIDKISMMEINEFEDAKNYSYGIIMRENPQVREECLAFVTKRKIAYQKNTSGKRKTSSIDLDDFFDEWRKSNSEILQTSRQARTKSLRKRVIHYRVNLETHVKTIRELTFFLRRMRTTSVAWTEQDRVAEYERRNAMVVAYIIGSEKQLSGAKRERELLDANAENPA